MKEGRGHGPWTALLSSVICVTSGSWVTKGVWDGFFFYFNVMEPGKSWSWRAERRGWLDCPYLPNQSGLPTSGWALVTAAVEWELHVSRRGV